MVASKYVKQKAAGKLKSKTTKKTSYKPLTFAKGTLKIINNTVFLYVDDLDPELTDPNYVPDSP